MAKELTAQEITDLISGVGKRSGGRIDKTEPRTMDNWWKQEHQIIYRPDHPKLDVKCTNPQCKDTRPDDKTILLARVKDTLICRYCFLDGYLST